VTTVAAVQWYSGSVLAERAVSPDRVRPLRRIEYEALVAQGLLDDSRIELLLGTLIEMTPQGPLHAEVVRRLSERFIRALPPEVQTRVQSPIALSDVSEPEPDIAVVPAGDYRERHPDQVLLVVEVADTSLEKDRGIKTALYATASIPEFWLVNLAERVIEWHREPSGGRYGTVQRVSGGSEIAPVEYPSVRIAVQALFE
jgi:Uma2 family endonuclease